MHSAVVERRADLSDMQGVRPASDRLLWTVVYCVIFCWWIEQPSPLGGGANDVTCCTYAWPRAHARVRARAHVRHACGVCACVRALAAESKQPIGAHTDDVIRSASLGLTPPPRGLDSRSIYGYGMILYLFDKNFVLVEWFFLLFCGFDSKLLTL